MKDIFEQKVLCGKCERVMKPFESVEDGFRIRFLKCEHCGERVMHPLDMQEYSDFMALKNKIFKVKLRVVGNSYAVSIPKEIVNFIKEEERIMNDMVRLCFEEAGKLSLLFSDAAHPLNNNGVIKIKRLRR